MRPLRTLGPVMDTFAMVPPAGIAELHMDPPHPVPYVGDGQMLGQLDGEAIDRFVAAVGPESGSPLLSAEIRHVGGGACPGRSRTTGRCPRSTPSSSPSASGWCSTRRCTTRTAPQLDKLAEAFAPYENGREYLNFTERQTDPARFYTPTVYRRLREVKAAYDPADVFRSNHPIPPA